MRIRLFSVVALLGSLLLESCYTRISDISSPDNNIRVSVSDSIMTVKYSGKVVQTIRIGDNHWTESSRIVETVDERYTMLSGKRRECTYKYRAMSCSDAQGKNLLVRVSNDGVAFRFNGADEQVSFVIPDGTKRWLQRQKTDYEGFYPESTQASNGKYSYPALVEYTDGMFGLITESGINHGNSCSYLTSSGDRYTVTYTDNDETDVHAWRILMLGSLADIVDKEHAQEIPTIEERETRQRFRTDMTVVRDGIKTELKGVDLLTLKKSADDDTPQLKIDFYIEPIEKNFGTVMQQTFASTVSVVRMVWGSLIGLIKGQFSLNDMSGPVGIASAITEVAGESLRTSGFGSAVSSIVYVMMVITINLGVVNMLPFPALDGGRFLMLLIEWIFRKPVPRKVESIINTVGLVLLLGLSVVIAFKDVWKLISGG